MLHQQCNMVWKMSIGTSGRIVIEIQPEIKRELYEALQKEGMTLKKWFLESAETFLSEKRQLPLFTDAKEGGSSEVQSR